MLYRFLCENAKSLKATPDKPENHPINEQSPLTPDNMVHEKVTSAKEQKLSYSAKSVTSPKRNESPADFRAGDNLKASQSLSPERSQQYSKNN